MVDAENRSGAYISVREPAHDPEIEFVSERSCAKSKFYSVLCACAQRCREAQESTICRPDHLNIDTPGQRVQVSGGFPPFITSASRPSITIASCAAPKRLL